LRAAETVTTDIVEVIPLQDGARVRLRVKPGARRQRLVGPHGGALKLEVTAPPERGKANAAVIALLARELELTRAAVEITVGAASQDKSVKVAGVTAAELARRLRELGIAAAVTDRGKDS
jgi:uncharacterized protein (TIGR00251 family)